MAGLVLEMGVGETKINLFPAAQWLGKQSTIQQIIASQGDKCFDRGVIWCPNQISLYFNHITLGKVQYSESDAHSGRETEKHFTEHSTPHTTTWEGPE